jgi:MYXO-CTERM domain-containing protein
MLRPITLSCAALVLLAASPARAHDFWLYPDVQHSDGPANMNVRIFIGGTDVAITEFPRTSSHISRFELHDSAGMANIAGAANGMSPAGRIILSVEDMYTVMYQSHYTQIELEAAKFEAYLREEGLLDIIAERAQRGESALPGRELFARYVKSIVQVGHASEGFDRRVGMPAELTMLDNPFLGGTGGTLTFELMFLGAPRAGALVDLFAVEETRLTEVAQATTDASGHVTFDTPAPGRYLAATTLMRRADPGLGSDWESFWESVTFGVEAALVPPKDDSSDGCSAGRGGGAPLAGLLSLGLLLGRRRRSR